MIQSLKALQEFLEQNGMKYTAQTMRAQIASKIPVRPSQQLLSLLNQQEAEVQSTKATKQTDIGAKRKNNRSQASSGAATFGGSASMRMKKKKRQDLPVQGLLGKIAYSSKLLESQSMNQQINHLMDNKIFLSCLNKLFPVLGSGSGQSNNMSSLQQQKHPNSQNSHFLQASSHYQDQLDLVEQPSQSQSQMFRQQHNQQHSNNDTNNNISGNSHPNNQISSIDFSNASSSNDFLQQGSSILSHTSAIMEEINKNNGGNGIGSINVSASGVTQQIEEIEEYMDDRDLGFYEYVFEESSLMEQCGEITKMYGYPDSAIRKTYEKDKKMLALLKENKNKKKKGSGQGLSPVSQSKFPSGMIFPCQSDNDDVYPLEYNGISYDVMKIKVIFDREKMGYEDTPNIQFKPGDIIAGRYQVEKVLGSGVFAKAIKAKDLSSDTDELTCFKVVENNKDFFDQAMDEIKLLRYIKANCVDPNKHYLLNFHQAFYHRQHLFIQTDLLKDDLFTAFQSNPSYFSIPIIRKISKQIMQALSTLHAMNIIHSDLKPENIMIKSYNPVEVRVIDLGNGCFTHDQNLGSYVQSRSYRAPEVVLGCEYDEKIDIWSVGCIVAELWTKNVLFYNHNIQGMIARIQGIVGPWPEHMLEAGQNVSNIFSKENLIYYEEQGQYHILVPKKTTLKNRIRSDDDQFIDFIRCLVQIDPELRLSAVQALNHPFLRGA